MWFPLISEELLTTYRNIDCSPIKRIQYPATISMMKNREWIHARSRWAYFREKLDSMILLKPLCISNLFDLHWRRYCIYIPTFNNNVVTRAIDVNLWSSKRGKCRCTDRKWIRLIITNVVLYIAITCGRRNEKESYNWYCELRLIFLSTFNMKWIEVWNITSELLHTNRVVLICKMTSSLKSFKVKRSNSTRERPVVLQTTRSWSNM